MRFTIRDLLWLTLAVACVVVWSRGRMIASATAERSPFPVGQVSDSFWQTSPTDDAADFQFHCQEFVGRAAALTPSGKRHLECVVLRWEHTPHSLLIELSSNPANSSLDASRRTAVVKYLGRCGIADADARVIVGDSGNRFDAARFPAIHALDTIQSGKGDAMKLKFQIRDLLWLMVVVACCALWWRDRVVLNRMHAEQERQAAQNKALMDFLNQSLLSVTPPPTPPPAAITTEPEGEVTESADERTEIDLGRHLWPLGIAPGALQTEPQSAGEEGMFLPLSFGAADNAFWLLHFEGTDAELREHLGQSKR